MAYHTSANFLYSAAKLKCVTCRECKAAPEFFDQFFKEKSEIKTCVACSMHCENGARYYVGVPFDPPRTDAMKIKHEVIASVLPQLIQWWNDNNG